MLALIYEVGYVPSDGGGGVGLSESIPSSFYSKQKIFLNKNVITIFSPGILPG